MGKGATVANSLFQEFFQRGLYKRSQGRITRQATFAVLFVSVALGSWRLKSFITVFADNGSPWLIYGVPILVLLIGLWLAFRLVNITRFADFLIAVEAEMNKVTWPTRTELVRSSMVVIFVIFSMAIVLFGFDLFWKVLFQTIGVLRE